MSPRALEALDELATRCDDTRVGTVRQALRLYDYVTRQREFGWTLYLEKGGERKELDVGPHGATVRKLR